MNSRNLALVGLVALVLVGLLPAGALAQPPAGNFNQLPGRIRVGDPVWVTGDDGREVKGKLWDLSPTSLKVFSNGQAREFTAESVRSVWTREHDGLANGALIGLAVGAGLGAIGMSVACEGSCYPEGVIAVLIYGGMGAGIGVGIDALIPGLKKQVYARGTKGPSPHVSLQPMLSPHGQGMIVRVAF